MSANGRFAHHYCRVGKHSQPPRTHRRHATILGHAANFLYMLDGNEPNPDAVKALDAYLVMLADHGFNASTFATRVTTGTLADVYSAITSGIGTLKGAAAHGGANQAAMEQFFDAAQRGDVAAWFSEARAEWRSALWG